jgi:NAD+--asparagine ADP-ribosyltransferase
MKEIDRNDVNIAQLFSWSKETAIADSHGNILSKLWVRLVGDADLNRARVFALRSSAELRIKLKDPKSDEHMAFIQDVTVVDKSNLVDVIVGLSLRDVTRNAYREVTVTIPKEPDSDASLEKQEKYQKEVDDYPKKREEAIRKYLKKKVDELTEKYNQLSDEDLQKKYESLMINELCEQESFKKFKEMCVYFSIYKDKNFKTRMFSSFDEFDNIAPEIKEKLMNEYTSLELDTDTLKK